MAQMLLASTSPCRRDGQALSPRRLFHPLQAIQVEELSRENEQRHLHWSSCLLVWTGDGTLFYFPSSSFLPHVPFTRWLSRSIK